MPEKYRIKSTVERPFVRQTLRHLRPVFAELARNKQTTGLGQITVADLKQLVWSSLPCRCYFDGMRLFRRYWTERS